MMGKPQSQMMPGLNTNSMDDDFDLDLDVDVDELELDTLSIDQETYDDEDKASLKYDDPLKKFFLARMDAMKRQSRCAEVIANKFKELMPI